MIDRNFSYTRGRLYIITCWCIDNDAMESLSYNYFLASLVLVISPQVAMYMHVVLYGGVAQW